MSRWVFGLSWWAAALAGCEQPPIEEQLKLTFTGETLIDSLCEEDGTCYGSEQINASIEYASSPSLTTGRVEFLQYRIDYDFSAEGLEDVPPYYANNATILVQSGAIASFSVRAASATQRDWVYGRFGSSRAEATATLSLAGYDNKNEVVIIKGTVPVAFQDLEGNGTTTTTTEEQ